VRRGHLSAAALLWVSRGDGCYKSLLACVPRETHSLWGGGRAFPDCQAGASWSSLNLVASAQPQSPRGFASESVTPILSFARFHRGTWSVVWLSTEPQMPKRKIPLRPACGVPGLVCRIKHLSVLLQTACSFSNESPGCEDLERAPGKTAEALSRTRRSHCVSLNLAIAFSTLQIHRPWQLMVSNQG